jgi:hypothetical protein
VWWWPFGDRDKSKQKPEERDERVEPAGVDIPYRYVLSRIRVRGTLVTEEDEFDGKSTSVKDVHVEVVQQGDTTVKRRKLRTGAGTQDVDATLTTDGRLQSVQHKSVGAGPAVVAAGAKLIGFIGGAVLSVANAVGVADVDIDRDGKAPVPDPREKWAEDHPDAARLHQAHKVLATEAADKLVDLQKQLIASDDLVTVRSLTARVAAVTSTLNTARLEVSRIETLFATWRASQTTTHTAALECLVDLDHIEPREVGTGVAQAPQVPQEGALGFDLWRDFRMILQVVDGRRSEDVVPTVIPAEGDAENTIVRWRVPRVIELWVWSQPNDGSDPTLVTRTPITVVDGNSDRYGMGLRTGAFGEHGGKWTFGEDGAPTAITTNTKSMAGALADAVGAAPEQLVGAVEQAKKLTDTINGIQDAAAERGKAAAERDLAIAKARVEELGINATEGDAAALARAEQAVKLRTATRAIAPGTDAFEDLKAELDRVKTQNDLDAARRTATMEGQLVDVKAEVARLEQEVLVAKANYEKLNPDKIGDG